MRVRRFSKQRDVKLSAVNPIFGISASTAFVFLLVLFLTGETMPYRCGTSIDLPRVFHPIPAWQAERRGALSISIMRDGKVFLGKDQVMVADLAPEIQQAEKSSPDRVAYLKVDVRARCWSVKSVLDQIRGAGISDVRFLVEQRRPAS